jgi:putative ATP-dependent endonuclease of OLD family
VEITRVLIKNFRSIKETEVSLGHCTVLIGPNNVGKTAILDAIRVALTRRWGSRGTGFNESDIHLPAGVTDPKLAPPINIQIELEESSPGEWSADLQAALTDIVQLDPVTGRSIIILSVTCGINPTTEAVDPKWEFLTIARRPVTGRGARSTNLQEFFQYLPVFYLKPTRDANDEFSPQSQFWGRLLRAMKVPPELQATLKTSLDGLNQQLLGADARIGALATDLKSLALVAPTDAPGELELRATALQAGDMLRKAEVIFKAHQDQPWLPLTNHGHGIQSLAVIFLFESYVKILLKEAYRPDSTAILQLEEPETHLHPQAIKSLCTTILSLSGQKILTTHSPYFLQSVPFRDIRLVRMSAAGATIAWLPPHFSTKVPHIPELDNIVRQHSPHLAYDTPSHTLTITRILDEKLYRQLLVAYSAHADVATITTSLRDLKARAKHHMSDDDLANLETWARRIRGEIFFARKWLLVEGQSDYLIMHTVAILLGYLPDQQGVSIIDAQNSGNPGTFAALARALGIPWTGLFDGDAGGQEFLSQIKNRGFDDPEVAARCSLIQNGWDMEELLVSDGLEQELRTILQRLGHADAPAIPAAGVITRLRKQKPEYAIELSNDLREDPTLVAKIPTTLKDAITRLQVVQS